MRILLLGGTSESSALATRLEGDLRFRPMLSLAGATHTPLLPAIPVRIGGYGGPEGLAHFLRASGTDAVVDATHPFAARISRNARQACRLAGIPLLRVARPAWMPQAADRWIPACGMQDAVRLLGETPRRVLLTIGAKDLAPFRDGPAHRYVVRSVDPPPPEMLPADAVVLAARGPFDLDSELVLLRAHAIEMLVTKNSGGRATRAKLDAARALGLTVVMIARPDPEAEAAPPGAEVADWQAAWSWLEQAAHESTLRRV